MRHSETGPGPRYSFSVELFRLSEALWNSSRLFLSRWDLSPSQFNILNLLDGETAGCTQIELSRRLITHRSNVTGLLDRLAARGLVERRTVPGDRRSFSIVLTLAGTNLVKRIQPDYYRALEQMWGNVSAGNARLLVKNLADVVANAERIAAPSILTQSNHKQGDHYERDD